MRTRVKALGPVTVATGPAESRSPRRSPVRFDGWKTGASIRVGRRWYMAAFWHRARRRR